MASLDFTGKIVWVTGAGKGIGYATALAFVAAGAQVTGFDLAFPGRDYPFSCETVDIADAAQAQAACKRLLAQNDRLDVLVNAAGILHMGATDALSAEAWQRTFAVNVGARSTCSSRRWRSSAVNRAGRSSQWRPMRRIRHASA